MPATDGLIFFVDDSAGAVSLLVRLRDLGEEVRELFEEVELGDRSEIKPPILARNEDDTDWIPKVAALGWVIITADKAMRRRPAEKQVLINSGAAAFVLTATKLKGDEIADVFEDALQGIKKTCSKYSRPLLATVTREANIHIEHGIRKSAVKR